MRRSSRQHLQQQQQTSSTGQDLDSSSSLPQLPPILSYPPSGSSVTTGAYSQQQQQGGYPLHRADEPGRHESYLQQQQYDQQLASNQPQHLQQYEHQQHQPQQQFAEQQQQRQESISSRRAASKREPATDMLGATASGSRSSIDDSMPSASDFVKKLYKMLEDQSIANVVSWGPQGDCFVVKDMNEFTKTILPRLFKHSNFASFVRQLNKYDFHKVKNGDDNQFGEHSWTFRHQNFHADRREDLENIKRKVPAGRKPTASLPPVSTSQPHTSQPLSSSSSHHQRGEYPYRRGSQSRHHSPSPYGGPPSPGSYEYGHGGYDHDSSYERHRHGSHHHHSSSYDHLQQQLSALQSQLTGLSSSTSALSAQLRALAESQQSLGRDVENVRGEVADVRRRESEIRDEMRRSMLAVNGASAGGASLALSSELSQLSRQTTKLTQDSDQMSRRVGDLERGYKNVLGEVGALQRGLLGAANTASTLSLGGAGANGAAGAAQSLEEMLKNETGVGLDSMTGVEAGTPGSNYWGVRGLVGGWLEGSNKGQSSQGRGEGSSSSPNLGGAADATADPSSDNAFRRQQGLDSNVSTSLSGGQPSSSSSPTNPTSPPTAAANNASASSSTSGRPAFTIPVTDDSRNPFLPMQLPPDAAKASLVQLNELSRRADQVGFSLDFGEGFQGGNEASPSSADGSSSWQQQQSQSPSAQSKQQQQQSQQRPPPTSKIWEAANNAGLFGNGVGLSYTGTSNDDSSVWSDTAVFNTGSQGSPGSSTTASGTSPTGSGNDAVLSHEGLQVYTVGHLVPRDQLQSSANQWAFGDPIQQQYSGGSYRQSSDGQFEEFQQGSSSRPSLNASTSAPLAGSSSSITEVTSPTSSSSSPNTSTAMVASSSNTTRPKLRVRRSTFVPGWAVPPRVLLVDDDAVSRKLGSKFLQVFGCAIDVAVDGVGAVNKMNLEKYDLVLMDIVMPKLDGISATSLIRKFDPMTPIISMTSNSKPSEIMTYYSSGMNDILPKPFTKEGMLDMLEKHLTHLRIIQQMSRGVPPSVGIPPLSDAGFQQALQASAANLLTGPSPVNNITSAASSSNNNNIDGSNTSNSTLTLTSYEDDGRINPLAGMGLSDDQYNSMLQDMVNGDPFFNGMAIDSGSNGIAGRRMNPAGASGSGSGMTLNLGFGVKRGYEESSSGNGEEGRDGKRSRFEVIE